MPVQREGVVLGDLHIVASQPRRHSPLPAFWRDSGGGRRRAVLLRAPSPRWRPAGLGVAGQVVPIA